MIDQIDKFVEFWTLEGYRGIINIFWFFFFLEVPRYLFFDVLVAFLIKRERLSKKYKEDREDLRIKLFTEKPMISVIVPGMNEGEHIYKLVQSLKSQTYKNFELIVIDDGSTDDTYLICNDLYKNGFIDIYLRNNERGGKASAANLGLRYASGKYVIHLDADTSLDTNAIEEIVLPFLSNPNIGAVGGNVKVRNRENVITNCQAMEYITSISLGRMVASYLGIYRVIPGAFGVFRRDLLNLLGGWDIGPGLDGDITVKIRKIGYDIYFAEKAVCLTFVPNTISKLTKQRLRWSKSIVRFRLRKHKDIFFPNQNFSFINFLSSFDNVFFTIVLNLLWMFYMAELIINFYDKYLYIFIFKVFLYSFLTFIQLIINLSLSERKNWEFGIFKYVPLMCLYTGYYMRFVRTIAYFMEFFSYSSYRDRWNPDKTSKEAKAYGL